ATVAKSHRRIVRSGAVGVGVRVVDEIVLAPGRAGFGRLSWQGPAPASLSTMTRGLLVGDTGLGRGVNAAAERRLGGQGSERRRRERPSQRGRPDEGRLP